MSASGHAAAARVGAAVSDREGQHHRPRRHRHRRDRRHPALRHRHHGDFARPARSKRKSLPSTRSMRRAACSAARSSSSRKTARATGRPSPKRRRSFSCNDKCAAVMGCWTSASRKAVLPVFEQYNGMLYYPTFYEGLEQSKNVIYTGQEATQQILAGPQLGAPRRRAPRPSICSAPTTSGRARPTRSRASTSKTCSSSRCVGEEYFPLGNTQFNSVINKIKLTKPDVIYAIIVGGSNVAFYKQLKAAGIDLTQADADDDLGHRGRDRRHRRREHRRRLCLHEVLRSRSRTTTTRPSSRRSTRCGATRP